MLDRFVGDATRPLRGGVNLLQVKLGRIRRSLARLFFLSAIELAPDCFRREGEKVICPTHARLNLIPDIRRAEKWTNDETAATVFA